MTFSAFEYHRRSTQQLIQGRLEDLDDFEKCSERFIDHDGIDLDTPKGIRVKVTKIGKSITFDFSRDRPTGRWANKCKTTSGESGVFLCDDCDYRDRYTRESGSI